MSWGLFPIPLLSFATVSFCSSLSAWWQGGCQQNQAFLNTLSGAVLITRLFVCPCQLGSMTVETSPPTHTTWLIYCVVSPVLKGHMGVIAHDGLLPEPFAPWNSSLVLWSVPLDVYWDPPCVCEPIPRAGNLYSEPHGALSRAQLLWTATACVSSSHGISNRSIFLFLPLFPPPASPHMSTYYPPTYPSIHPSIIHPIHPSIYQS